MKPSIALALAVVLLPGCIGRSDDPGVYVVAEVVGNVQVRPPEGVAFRNLSEGSEVAVGAAIRVSSSSTVTLTRGEESAIRLRPFEPGERCRDLAPDARARCIVDATGETQPPAEMSLVSAERFAVSSGDVLVQSDADAPISVESRGIAARSESGTFRFDRRLSLRIGVYEGTTTVEAAGAILALPSLRQGVVAGRALPRTSSLLRFRPSDPWDRELLKDVIDLDSELLAQRRGYEAEFGARTSRDDVDDEMAALQDMFPARDVAFARSSLRSARKGDVLVGMVLAVLLEQRQRGAAPAVYPDLLAARERGATWGLLARDNQIPSQDVVGGVVRAIGLRTGDVEPTPEIVEPFVPTPGQPDDDPDDQPDEQPTTDPTPTRTRSPRPTRSPSPSTSPSPSPTCTQVGPICV